MSLSYFQFEPMADTKRENGWIRQHPGVALSVAAVVFVLIKVLRVSHYDLETALALLGTASPFTMLLGSLVLAVPYIFFLTYVYLVFWVVDDLFLGSLSRRHSYAFGAMVSILLLLPWQATLGALAVLFAYVGFRWKFRPKDQTDIVALLGSMLLIFVILDAQVWIPAERLAITGKTDFTGYVIDEDGESTAILRDAERSIIRVDPGLITARVPCNVGSIGKRITILDLLTETSRLRENPPCDDDSGEVEK